jgi:MSHA pilin protein MshA
MEQTATCPSILNNQKGFTLIELIMVIVILGILAVVAIPKYQDIQTEAAIAAAEGVYGAAQGAAAINFAANLVGKGLDVIDDGATLLAALDGTPEGWTSATDTIIGPAMPDATIPTITVTTAEDADSKAVLALTYEVVP